jgi:hypothetical protein
VARLLYGVTCPLLVADFPGNTGETWRIHNSMIWRVSRNRE